jgi:hypothetical protein
VTTFIECLKDVGDIVGGTSVGEDSALRSVADFRIMDTSTKYTSRCNWRDECKNRPKIDCNHLVQHKRRDELCLPFSKAVLYFLYTFFKLQRLLTESGSHAGDVILLQSFQMPLCSILVDPLRRSAFEETRSSYTRTSLVRASLLLGMKHTELLTEKGTGEAQKGRK